MKRLFRDAMKITQKKAVTLLRFLFPLWALVGLFSIFYVPSKLIVFEDAALTASNILANPLLFSLGIVGILLTQIIFIVTVLVMYKLFEKVNKDYSLLMVILALVSVPIAMLNALNLVAAKLSIANADKMMLFLNLNVEGMMIASVFWGLWLFPYGYLVYKAYFFPKFLGVLVMIAGLGYTLAFFAHFLLPIEALISVFEFLTIGETLFMLWVVVLGAKIR
jgi:magnesium-transporting ATPase (P-type)